MTNIIFKPKETFRTEDHKANLMNSAKIQASLKAEDYPERDRLEAAIERNEDSDVAPELRIKAHAEGRTLPVPATLEAQLYEKKVVIRDKNDALDYLADKAKAFEYEAGRKMVEAAKPQIVAAEKEIYGTVQTLFDQYSAFWTAKRQLINNGVPTLGLFDCPLDEVMGIPQGANSAWYVLFKHGVERGCLRMPKDLLPK